MSWWRRLFGGPSVEERAFATLAERWPELRFVPSGSDVTEVFRGDQRVLVMSLATLRERVAQGGEEGLARWLADPQMKSALDLAAGRVEAPRPTREVLVPRFAPARRFDEVAGGPPAHREVLPDVWLTVAAHWDDWGARYLGEDELAELGLDFEAALGVAIVNLDRELAGNTRIDGVPAPDGSPALLVLDHRHAAAALLLPGIRALLTKQLGSPCLVMIPQTDELIAAPLEPRARAEGFFDTARRTYAASAHPVSDRVLLVTAERFDPA